MRLGGGDGVDHAVIGLAGRFAEGEDAVLVEDQALDGGVLLEHLGGRLGEIEARHDVGHEAEALAKNCAADLLAVFLVDETENGGRVRVVDEFVRQEGVQQRLDRGVGRRRVDEVGALQRHHVLVRKPVQLARLEQRAELHGRQALRLDDAHVPAAALDAEHVPAVADEIGCGGLYRGVAAAMQHQARIAAEQARRVNAQRQIPANAFPGIVLDQLFGFDVVPEILHLSGVRLVFGGETGTPRRPHDRAAAAG